MCNCSNKCDECKKYDNERVWLGRLHTAITVGLCSYLVYKIYS